MVKNLLALVIVGAISACSGAPTVRSGLEIITERSDYVLVGRYSFIEIVIANPTAKPVALATCVNVVTTLTEIEVDGKWTEHGTNVSCVNGGLGSFTIHPGEQLTASAVVHEHGRSFRVRAALFVDGQTIRFSRETSRVFDVRY